MRASGKFLPSFFGRAGTGAGDRMTEDPGACIRELQTFFHKLHALQSESQGLPDCTV